MHPQQIPGRSLQPGVELASHRRPAAGIEHHVAGVVGFVGRRHHERRIWLVFQRGDVPGFAQQPGFFLCAGFDGAIGVGAVAHDRRNWLFGLGDGIRIEAPTELRGEHQSWLRRSLDVYGSEGC
jgi:hypothetical protein